MLLSGSAGTDDTWKGGIDMGNKEMDYEGVAWIQLAQSNFQWRASANRVMTFASHKIRGIFLVQRLFVPQTPRSQPFDFNNKRLLSL